MFLIMKPNAVTLYLHTLNKREMALLEKDVIVKKSKLPGAGKGLFAKKFIPKGTRIVEYKGRIKTWKEVNPDKHEN